MKKVYGVSGSHILHSWRIVNGLKDKKEFGYGAQEEFSYNVPKSLLYKDNEKPKVKPDPVPEVPKKINKGGCPPGSRRSFGLGCVVIF